MHVDFCLTGNLYIYTIYINSFSFIHTPTITCITKKKQSSNPKSIAIKTNKVSTKNELFLATGLRSTQGTTMQNLKLIRAAIVEKVCYEDDGHRMVSKIGHSLSLT